MGEHVRRVWTQQKIVVFTFLLFYHVLRLKSNLNTSATESIFIFPIHPQLSQMILDDLSWSQMIPDDPRWFPMIPSDCRWSWLKDVMFSHKSEKFGTVGKT